MSQIASSTWHADPLVWGNGPTVFELFLEPTCAFSVKAFNKIWPLIDRVGEKQLTVKIRLQSQPWHLYSGVVVRCVLAASTTPGGKDAAKAVLAAVAANRDAYEFEKHGGGANMDVTPHQLIARLEQESGVPLAAAFALPDLDKVVKWHCKYARQNGIHVSPTFMVDGLVDPAFSSGEDMEAWATRLTT
ncbi:DsbA family protein [Robbsia andropogonis]|uniref:thioredoxin n=1 Tax=Robbsia andropogonis TaxID=28092 RepID=UPI0004B91475|nr:thioredoxin [Robbsia andropogonis]MCP1118827.1 thioredoxin [Robbsia andropogonis]MCP1128294.1 thioredoxin [Robbsia andropogonis]